MMSDVGEHIISELQSYSAETDVVGACDGVWDVEGACDDVGGVEGDNT